MWDGFSILSNLQDRTWDVWRIDYAPTSHPVYQKRLRGLAIGTMLPYQYVVILGEIAE